MPKPSYQRRKEDRPQEITEAAFEAFAENGYAATRVEEVAKRAGVSKGLLYLYFRTKEELFKAVVRGFVAPKVTELSNVVEESGLSAVEFIRGPFLTMLKSLPDSPVKVMVRLMFAEGHNHPDLVAFYWDNVVTPALGMMETLLARGVENGEFRRTSVNEFPQLLASPVIFSLVWHQVFGARQRLDPDRLIETHIEAMLNYIAAPTNPGGDA